MKKPILVLNEDLQELRKLREVLTKEGFNIITSTDKETAIELCRHINFLYVLGPAHLLGFNSTDNDDPKSGK